MPKEMSIVVNGVTYDDYVSGNVVYSMDQLARSFNFTFANRWTPSRFKIPFKEGDPVKIKVQNTTVIDGFVDAVPVNYNAESSSFQVIGRSWTGHLVDCSAIYQTGCWSNSTLQTIATNICAPFGIKVRIDPWALVDAAKPFPRFAIQDEETAFACISRAAKERGLFLISDGSRTLVITKASYVVALDNLVLGDNIHSASRQGDFQSRFSTYIVKSQRTGNDLTSGPVVEAGLGQAQDPQVTTYRPLVIFAESQADPADCTLRAQWERNVRAGKSRRITYTTKGSLVMRVRNGPWEINQVVPVDDYVSDIQANLLITSVGMSIGANESQTVRIEVTTREAYDSLLSPTPQLQLPGGWLT